MQRRSTLLTAMLVICALMAFGGVAAAQTEAVTENVIHASGSGSVTGTPDRVQISFSVLTEHMNVKSAQEDNAARMDQVINALVTAGVSRDSMKTTGYTITQTYHDLSNPLAPKIQTYQVTNTLQVTLDNVTRSGEIIDTAVAYGVNQVGSIQFMLSDAQARSLRSAALKNAVMNARADADTVAGVLGVTITGIKNVDISQGYMPVIYDSSGLSAVAAKVMTPVQPGEITVTAQVTITYSHS